MIQIKPEHIANKKVVGRIGSNKIFQVVTTGGLWMYLTNEGGKATVVATGPHRAVARHLLMKMHPEAVLTDLMKADYVPMEFYKDLIPQYEQLTNQIRALQGIK